MPKIVSKKLRWNFQQGTDGFFLYYGPHVPGVSLTEASPKVDAKLPELDADGKHAVFFSDFPDLAALPEGDYDFAVSGYDRAGNESGLSEEVEQVPLDLTAPATPTGVEVVDA